MTIACLSTLSLLKSSLLKVSINLPKLHTYKKCFEKYVFIYSNTYLLFTIGRAKTAAPAAAAPKKVAKKAAGSKRVKKTAKKAGGAKKVKKTAKKAAGAKKTAKKVVAKKW